MGVINKSFISTDEGQLYCRQLGDGKPLLLLQLLPFGAEMFEPAMPALAESGVACWAVDVMGYGASDRRTRSWSIRDFANNMLRAMDCVGVTHFDVLGGHFTSLVAVEMALLAPERISLLILDGVPLWSDEQRHNMLQNIPETPGLDAPETRLSKAWSQFYATLSKLDPGFNPTEHPEGLVLDLFSKFLRATYRPGTTEKFFAYPAIERLGQIQQPTLVIGSPADSLLSYHVAAVELIEQASGVMLDDAHPIHKMTGGSDVSPWVNVVTKFLN